MRYFLHLAYNGENFHGWQVQEGQHSVQEALETALRHLCQTPIQVLGCGRTDSGVHAEDFYAHFDYKPLDNKEREQLVFKLNRYFVHDILIYGLYAMKDDAHARFDAVSRTYKYHLSITKQPFRDAFCYYHPWSLDVDKMNQAAERLLGTKDFTSFSKLHTQVNNNICTITEARWESIDGELIFTISANRFLRNMVRAVVGTLLLVGRHKISLEEFDKIIEEKNRCKAGISVPAKALFLHKVEYPETIFL
jgi:tRNA pseudouridine38-40 synthase